MPVIIIPESLEYMRGQKLPEIPLSLLSGAERKVFSSREEWEKHLENLGIVQKRHIQIACETKKKKRFHRK